MRKFISLIVLPMASGGWAGANGNFASASATASVSVLPPIAVTKVQDLWFGEVIVEPGLPGRVIEQNAGKGGGTREADAPGVQTVVKRYGSWRNAEFEITGQPYASFSLDLPAYRTVYIQGTSGGSPIPMALSVPEFDAYRPSSIGQDGRTRIWIGGKLVLPAAPTAGYYQGQFSITVAYQ